MSATKEYWKAEDAAAARLVKLSMTGATHTLPPTIAPALMRERRENCACVRRSSPRDSFDMFFFLADIDELVFSTLGFVYGAASDV